MVGGDSSTSSSNNSSRRRLRQQKDDDVFAASMPLPLLSSSASASALASASQSTGVDSLNGTRGKSHLNHKSHHRYDHGDHDHQKRIPMNDDTAKRGIKHQQHLRKKDRSCSSSSTIVMVLILLIVVGTYIFKVEQTTTVMLYRKVLVEEDLTTEPPPQRRPAHASSSSLSYNNKNDRLLLSHHPSWKQQQQHGEQEATTRHGDSTKTSNNNVGRSPTRGRKSSSVPFQGSASSSRNGLMIRGSLRVTNDGQDFIIKNHNDPLLLIPETISTTAEAASLFDDANDTTRRDQRQHRQQQPQERNRRVVLLEDDFYPMASVNTNDSSSEIVDQQGRTLQRIVRNVNENDEDNESEGIQHQEGDNNDDHEHILPFQRPFLEECEQVIQPSPPKANPTCNTLHEIPIIVTSPYGSNPMNVELLSTRGSWRTAWKVDYYSSDDDESQQTRTKRHRHKNVHDSVNALNGTAFSASSQDNETAPEVRQESVVMKLLHLSREFDVESYQAHETDVIVMDKLTTSPYVVNAYGFCGQSVLTDYAPISGRDYVKSYDVRNRERLRIGRDLARGLADIQSLQPIPWTYLNDRLLEIQRQQQLDLMSMNQTKEQYEESSSVNFETFLSQELVAKYPTVFAHNDINIANTVYVDGKVKWNDFNIGVFLRKPTNSSSMNPVTIANPGTNETFVTVDDINSKVSTDLCPSPVMFRGDLWRSPEEVRNTSYVHLQMSDMYGFANILYQTMSRHQPWTHKETTGALTITEIADRKRQGKVPVIPEQYRNATQRDLQSLYVATLASYHPHPSERPGALRMATSLSSLYNRIQNKTRLTRGMILDFFVPNRPSSTTNTNTTTTTSSV